MNYIGIIFTFGGIGAVVGGMVVALVYEAVRKRPKKRNKWWELRIE